jgi:hypothetical protein
MKRVSQLFASMLIVLFFTVSLSAQSDKPRPDGWRGLALDISNPDDAIRLFGIPVKDKDKIALNMQRPLSWLSDKYRQKIFKTLTYKKLYGYKQVQLSFLGNKLVLISLEAPNAELEENWIDPDDLESLFAVNFRPHHRKYRSKLPPPSEFQANAPTELKKEEYDYWYDMIAVTDRSFIVAIADNYKYISGLFDSPDVKKRKEINARGKRYPGYVSHIEIISRSLAS